MKAIYVVFDDNEFKIITKKKKKLSWREFILNGGKNNENNTKNRKH